MRTSRRHPHPFRFGFVVGWCAATIFLTLVVAVWHG